MAGMELTEQEFKYVNLIYMLTDEVTKQYFAEQFSRLGLIKLVRAWIALDNELSVSNTENRMLNCKLEAIKLMIERLHTPTHKADLSGPAFFVQKKTGAAGWPCLQ